MQSATSDTANPMMAAEEAHARGDLSGAHAAWEAARAADNPPVAAWLVAAKHAGDVLTPAAVLALLQDAASRFPQDANVQHDLARAAERVGDWAAAERAWRVVVALLPQMWWAHTELARALAALDRVEEAEAVLLAGAEALPDEPRIAIELARLADRQGALTSALERWTSVTTRWPDAPEGALGRAATLARLGREQEAMAAYEAAADAFPDRPEPLEKLAVRAQSVCDWPAAERWWARFVAQSPRFWWVHTGLATALEHQGRSAEADAALDAGENRFPDEPGLPAFRARLLGDRGRWDASLAVAEATILRFPADWRGYRTKIAALGGMGRREEADVFLFEQSTRFPDDVDALHDYGHLAERWADWGEAEATWRKVVQRAPRAGWAWVGLARTFRHQKRWSDAREVLAEARRKLPGDDLLEAERRLLEDAAAEPNAVTASLAPAPAPVARSEAEVAEIRALLMRFESLGGGGHGCEFGIFQREFGAEPLGLLRWADVFQTQLATALETEFAGVGELENMNIFIPPTTGRPEYWTTDKRHHMAMRCFIYPDEVSLEEFTRQITRRFAFLRRKLLDDLREGSKIFVYKNMKQNLTAPELDRLHAACRRFGDNVLLYIRYADADHPDGTVRQDRPGLLVGYVDHFSHTPDTDLHIGSATTSFLKVCRQAAAMFDDLRRGGAAAAPAQSTVPEEHAAAQEPVESGAEPVRSVATAAITVPSVAEPASPRGRGKGKRGRRGT